MIVMTVRRINQHKKIAALVHEMDVAISHEEAELWQMKITYLQMEDRDPTNAFGLLMKNVYNFRVNKLEERIQLRNQVAHRANQLRLL